MGKRHWFSKWLAGLSLLCFINTANALDPNRVMSQYQDDHWGLEQGFPGGMVYAITQTSDGYLWIGAENGLVRFDGLTFVLLTRTNFAPLSLGPVLGLIADGEGNLWVRTERWGLLRYRAGAFQYPFSGSGQGEWAITAMCRGNSGEALFSGHISNALRYSHGNFKALAVAAAAPNALVMSMAETPAGDVWMGTRDSGLVSLSNGRFSRVAQGSPDKKINSLLPVGHRELWIGTDNGVLRWNGTDVTRSGVPPALNHVQILAMITDRESNTWVGTARGLYRINPRGVSSPEKRDNTQVNALFEDREGNLWVGAAHGIERLRDNTFLTYSSSRGLPSDNNGSLYVDAGQRTWFAPSEGGVYWLKGAQIERVANLGLSADVVYSITGGADEVWLGRQRSGLTRLRYRGGSSTADTFTQSEGLVQNSVYTVHRSRDGTVWAGTLSGGVSRFRNGEFTTYTTASGLAANTVSAIEESADGTMYFATPNGLSALSNEHWRTYSGRDGLPPGSVNCLLEGSHAMLWIGTGNGLAFLNAGRIQIPNGMPESLHEDIFGIAQDGDGYLWVGTSNHVLRVNRNALLSGAMVEADVREYGPADGLLGTEVVKRDRSVISDPLGRIWFSMNSGISVVDPARLARKMVPALVHIQGISADGRQIGIAGSVRIPAARQRVTFSYAGVSLSMPEHMKFRYKLDRFDYGWSEPVSAREAVYTNLSPGSYRFRVIASNADGLWNSEQATIGLEMEPAFWQTWWFRIACAAAFLVTALIFYRSRMHQMARQLSLRFEERLAERTRIAQELHDTLLQGVLSASMQLHVAVERVPVESPAKLPLNRVLELMGQVIDEGRNAVRGLRSGVGGSLNLEEALSRVREELGVKTEIEFRVIVAGQRRPLHPVLRDEVYRIGREALVNAFRHSRAKSVEMELEYAAHHLRLLVRDNGCGVDPLVLRSGRDGHWGLSGMRERAEGIGARLNLWSSATAGTEVELSVPGHLAFLSQSSGRRGRGFARFIPRKVRL
jgi:signal transduction histidine kinase/ligand-binding sensor domain-containing protein